MLKTTVLCGVLFPERVSFFFSPSEYVVFSVMFVIVSVQGEKGCHLSKFVHFGNSPSPGLLASGQLVLNWKAFLYWYASTEMKSESSGKILVDFG